MVLDIKSKWVNLKGRSGDRHTLLEQSAAQVIQPLPGTGWELLQLLKQRTNWSRHLECSDGSDGCSGDRRAMFPDDRDGYCEEWRVVR